jgi:heptosyltransferase-2
MFIGFNARICNATMKPKLLVMELWGIGDLAIATPFLQAASRKYEVTLLAKPFAVDLQKSFWPDVRVVPFVAPWTAFTGKYRFFSWPWLRIFRLIREMRRGKFDLGISARWDPRDHFFLWMFNVKQRIGFPRLQSQRFFLKQSRALPDPISHRYEYWREMANALGVDLPPREQLVFNKARQKQRILIHSGAARSIRVWPLVRYRNLVGKLRESGFDVQVASDPDQRDWWLNAGEKDVVTPATINELLQVIADAACFIGNDSGPGHLAAISGIPTFTIFGPQLPEWFMPIHPRSEFVEGKACPYKPCFDYCRFPAPHCLINVSEEEVLGKVLAFLKRNEIPAADLLIGKSRAQNPQ